MFYNDCLTQVYHVPTRFLPLPYAGPLLAPDCPMSYMHT